MYKEILYKAKQYCVAHNVNCKSCKYHSICNRYNITPFGVDTYIKFLIDIDKES